MQTLTLINEFLDDSGAPKGLVVAGGQARPVTVDTDRLNRLIDALEVRRKASSHMAYVVLCAFFGALALYVFAAWQFRTNDAAFLSILGVGGGGIAWLLVQFRTLWRERTLLDTLGAILPGATADEAIKALLAIAQQFGSRSQPSLKV